MGFIIDIYMYVNKQQQKTLWHTPSNFPPVSTCHEENNEETLQEGKKIKACWNYVPLSYEIKLPGTIKPIDARDMATILYRQDDIF